MMHTHNTIFKRKAEEETPEPTHKTRRRRIKGTGCEFRHKTVSKRRAEEETPSVCNKRIKITGPNDQLTINQLPAVKRTPSRTQKRKRGKCNQLKYTPETCDLLSEKWRQLPWTVTARFLAKYIRIVSLCYPTPLPAYPHVAPINSLSIDIVLLVADLLNLRDLFSLIRPCRSLHTYFLPGYFSSIIRKKKTSLLLLSAVESCHTNLEDNNKVVEMLLRDSTDPNIRSRYGSDILQIAVQYPSGCIVSQLLEYGCNPNSRDQFGRTSLYHAIIAHRIDKMKLLSKYADPNARSGGPGWTPLHYATYYGYEDLLELLCTHGASVDETDLPTLGTPLHFAYRYSHRATGIQLVLRRFGANKKTVDFLGLPPANYPHAVHRHVLHSIAPFPLYTDLIDELLV